MKAKINLNIYVLHRNIPFVMNGPIFTAENMVTAFQKSPRQLTKILYFLMGEFLS